MLLTQISAFLGERNMIVGLSVGLSQNNFIFHIVKCSVIYSKTIIKSAIVENLKIVDANVTQSKACERATAAPLDSNQFSYLIIS